MRPPIEAFEEHLRNRPEGISTYTVRGYLADLKKFGEWFKVTNDENMRLRNVTSFGIITGYTTALESQWCSRLSPRSTFGSST